jgi:hypothetical protein
MVGNWRAAVRDHCVRDGALMPSAPRSRRLLVKNAGEEAQRAVDWADVAAMLGDFEEAVSWLDRVAALLGSLPPDLEARRRDWLTQLR